MFSGVQHAGILANSLIFRILDQFREFRIDIFNGASVVGNHHRGRAFFHCPGKFSEFSLGADVFFNLILQLLGSLPYQILKLLIDIFRLISLKNSRPAFLNEDK